MNTTLATQFRGVVAWVWLWLTLPMIHQHNNSVHPGDPDITTGCNSETVAVRQMQLTCIRGVQHPTEEVPTRPVLGNDPGDSSQTTHPGWYFEGCALYGYSAVQAGCLCPGRNRTSGDTGKTDHLLYLVDRVNLECDGLPPAVKCSER